MCQACCVMARLCSIAACTVHGCKLLHHCLHFSVYHTSLFTLPAMTHLPLHILPACLCHMFACTAGLESSMHSVFIAYLPILVLRTSAMLCLFLLALRRLLSVCMFQACCSNLLSRQHTLQSFLKDAVPHVLSLAVAVYREACVNACDRNLRCALG